MTCGDGVDILTRSRYQAANRYIKKCQEDKVGGRESLTHNAILPPRKEKDTKEIGYEEFHIGLQESFGKADGETLRQSFSLGNTSSLRLVAQYLSVRAWSRSQGLRPVHEGGNKLGGTVVTGDLVNYSPYRR